MHIIGMSGKPLVACLTAGPDEQADSVDLDAQVWYKPTVKCASLLRNKIPQR